MRVCRAVVIPRHLARETVERMSQRIPPDLASVLPRPRATPSLAGDTALALARTIVDSLGSVGLTLIVARKLGAESLGVYAYGLAPAAIFAAATSAPMTQIVMREIARRPRRARRYVSNAMLLRILISFPLGVLLALAVAYLLPMSHTTREVTV